MELEELQAQIEEYSEKGFMADVRAACEDARLKTKHYIMRTHPSVAFGGKNLIHDDVNNADEIIRGKFVVEGSGVISANIYANYFARWYNTGAFGRVIKSGPYKGRHGPHYAPRGAYFSSNKQAIEEYYAQCVLDYLKEHIKL